MVYKPQTLDTKVLRQSLSEIGLERVYSPFLSQISTWVTCNGEEWTVKRLKSYKVAFLQLLAGKVPEWGWIAHKNNLPKGALRPVFRKGLTDPKSLSRVLTVLQFYLTFRSRRLTSEQKEKASNSITSGRQVDDTTTCRRGLEREARKFRRVFNKHYDETFTFAGWTTSKPVNGNTTSHPWVISFLESCFRSGPWSPILASMGVPTLDLLPMEVVGRISVIQEKGYKARVVASPNSGAQVAFRPLHSALNRVLKGLRTDCTFDQESGARWAQNKLKEGSLIWSIDLSSATDRFPLDSQLEVLKGLGYTWTKQFEGMARHTLWKSAVHDGRPIRYGAGQPMGLYGSFALFALTHNLLLAALGGTPDQYRILGDDIVISDGTLAERYISWLNEQGVPVSWHKSLLGAEVAEFAGWLITPDKIIKGSRYPDGLQDPWTFVQQTKITHIPLWSTVPKGYRKLARQLVGLPEELGGCGLNPEGLPMVDRVVGWSTLVDQSARLPKLKDPNAVLNAAVNPFASIVPGSGDILTFLADQARSLVMRIREDLHRKGITVVDRYPDDIVISVYMAVSRKGVSAWLAPGTTKSVLSRWKQTSFLKTVKPSWRAGE